MNGPVTGDALVLAGGGVAGIAWETGVLLGLQDSEPDFTQRLLAASTTLIGTSAGSTVAAQLAGGAALSDLFDAQTSEHSAELLVTLDLAELGAMIGAAMAGATSPEEARRRLGAIAREAETPTPAARFAVIEARIGRHEWPERPLRITAIDTETGDLRVFDKTSGVDLVDAVAASSAVPGIWPTVEIKGRHHMDGGMRTVANADLAAGADRVLILVPSLPESPLGAAIPASELEALAPGRVHVIYADDASLAAMGANPLDPASRGPAARAGREVGRRVAHEVAEFWG